MPAFMPPTWVILSFIYVNYNLLFLPTLVLGVIAATSGRIVLALIARKWFKRFLPEKFVNNYIYLGRYLKNHEKLTIPVVFGYAFSPLSSNSLFIVAGLSNLNLKIIAVSFFIGRLITYSFWITTSNRLAHRLDDIFVGNFSNIGTFIGALVSLCIVFIIGKVKWSKILKLK
jgi:membrane protein YqaA with SNARE-associated domain